MTYALDTTTAPTYNPLGLATLGTDTPYRPPVDVFPDTPPIAPTYRPPGSVTDAAGNIYAGRGSVPLAPTTGAFNPGAGQWGNYGDPTKGPWTSEIINGQQYVNGGLFDAGGLSSGNTDFANWEAHHKPIYDAQWEAYRSGGTYTPPSSVGTGDPGFGGVPNTSGLARDPAQPPLPNTGAPAVPNPTAPSALPPGTDPRTGGPFDYASGDMNFDFDGLQRAASDAAYRRSTQFMDEDFAREDDALESRLVNQGFARGSEAFNNESSRLSRGHNSARQGAALAAQEAGHRQALGIANLGLGRYGIDTSRRTTMDTAGLSADLALRRLGLDEDSQGFAQLMALISGARGGVNVPNFGAPNPLDVGSAYNIAGRNNDSQLNRDASDRTNWFNLGGSALSGFDWSSLFK